MLSKTLTPEQALQYLKEGKEVMVTPHSGCEDDEFVGITMGDFIDDETDAEILEYLEEKTGIQFWPEPLTEDKIYSLCETVADIAYIAGDSQFYSGDSRADIATIIEWAKEFEELHSTTKWGEDIDYIDTVYEFTKTKIDPTDATLMWNGTGSWHQYLQTLNSAD